MHVASWQQGFVIATETGLQSPEGVEKYGYRNVDSAAASLVVGQVWVEDGEEDCDNSDDSDDGSQWHLNDQNLSQKKKTTATMEMTAMMDLNGIRRC